jgi:hypothetical protein
LGFGKPPAKSGVGGDVDHMHEAWDRVPAGYQFQSTGSFAKNITHFPTREPHYARRSAFFSANRIIELMKAFLFGAGSSYGTLEHYYACPPLAKDFGRALSEQRGFPGKYPNLSLAAQHIGQDLAKIGLEQLWTCLDYYSKLSGDVGALGETPQWLWPAVRELKERALLSLIGRSCDKAADALPVAADYTLGDILKNQIQPGDVVISFNWDTVLERLAPRFEKNFQHRWCAATDVVRFAKPHGSASWALSSPPPAVFDGAPLLESLAEDMKNNPFVLGAVPIKSELLREVQKCHSPGEIVFKVIMHQWGVVVDAVRDADELVVVGYSFPKEDLYGRFLFQEGLRQRRTKSLRRVEYYNTSAKSGTSILEVFGAEGTEVVWKGRVTCSCDHCCSR